MSGRNGAPTASAAPRPTTTPDAAAGSVAGRIARSQVRRVDGGGDARADAGAAMSLTGAAGTS